MSYQFNWTEINNDHFGGALSIDFILRSDVFPLFSNMLESSKNWDEACRDCIYRMTFGNDIIDRNLYLYNWYKMELLKKVSNCFGIGSM